MPNTKTYVLDTTVLIDDPDIMYKLNGTVVIHVAVIKEIDGLKRSDAESVAQAARKVARTLDRLGSYGDLREGVKLSTGGILKVYNSNETVDGLASEADNRIVGAAVRLQKEVGNVILLTTDGNMRTIARVSGVKGEGYEGEGINSFPFLHHINKEQRAENIKPAREIKYLSKAKNILLFFRVILISSLISFLLLFLFFKDESLVGELFLSLISTIALTLIFYAIKAHLQLKKINQKLLYKPITEVSHEEINAYIPSESYKYGLGDNK